MNGGQVRSVDFSSGCGRWLGRYGQALFYSVNKIS